jgi:diguanylate cyclase (GGDEF)-like protein
MTYDIKLGHRGDFNMLSFLAIFINVSSIILVGVIIFCAWKQRSNTGTSELIAACVFMLIWASCSFIEILVTQVDQKIFWRNVTQIGVFYTPPACLLFAAVYSGYSKLLNRPFIALIYGIQTINILLVMTDEWHHMIRKSIEVIHHTNYDTVVVNTTFLAKILISINFIYLAAALIMLIIFAIKTSNKMRKQVLITTAGMSIAVIYAILKVVSNERFGMIMPISGIFAVVCITMLLGVLKYDFLMVVPIARKEVFDILDEGIIIASPKGEVIDANKAALRVFADTKNVVDTKNYASLDRIIEEKYSEWHNLLKQCHAEKIYLSQQLDHKTFYYECNTYVVDNNKKRTIGTISLIRDITEQRTNHELLKNKAERDGLTGVYNRLTFIELTKEEIKNTQNDVSLIFIDIDNFKEINDSYGHIAGDAVLKELCICLENSLFDEAIIGRIGGEEFAVFVSRTDIFNALRTAENLRINVEQNDFNFPGKILHVTISIGVASGKGLTFDQLYQKADRMLYLAKESGKNCVKPELNE